MKYKLLFFFITGMLLASCSKIEDEYVYDIGLYVKQMINPDDGSDQLWYFTGLVDATMLIVIHLQWRQILMMIFRRSI